MQLPGWLVATFRFLGRVAPGVAGRLAFRLLTTPRQNPPQPWETAPLAAGERAPRALTLRCGLAALAWEPAAGADTAPWIFAIHGWEGRPTQFRVLANALVPRGFRVLSIEAPGHGRSLAARWGRRGSPHLFSEALREAQAEFGPPAAVLGHSMGGCGVPIAISRGFRPGKAVLLGAPARMSGIAYGFAQALQLSPRALASFEAASFAHGGDEIRALDGERLAAGFPPGAAPPALVVHCEDDAVIPHASGQQYAAAWPGARLLLTRGLGHRNVLIDATVVDAVAAFVAA